MTVILTIIHLYGAGVALEQPMPTMEYCEAVASGHNSYHRPFFAYCKVRGSNK
jgi:hypothetical protein